MYISKYDSQPASQPSNSGDGGREEVEGESSVKGRHQRVAVEVVVVEVRE